MCNKMAFESKADARRYLSEVRRGSRGQAKNWKKLQPYQCLFCDEWHLTTMRKRDQRRVYG